MLSKITHRIEIQDRSSGKLLGRARGIVYSMDVHEVREKPHFCLVPIAFI